MAILKVNAYEKGIQLMQQESGERASKNLTEKIKAGQPRGCHCNGSGCD